MTTPHRTLQMALDALTVIGMNYAISYKHWPQADAAIAALREALNAPEPEPVARVAEVHMSRYTIEWTNGPLPEGTGLYAAPPAAPAPAAPVPDGWVPEWAAFLEYWTHEGHLQTFADRERFRAAAKAMIAAAPAAPVVPLTEGRITAIANELAFGGGHCNVYELARAIEAAHGITGGKP